MSQEFQYIANNQGYPFLQYTSDNSEEWSYNLPNASTITVNPTPYFPVPEAQRQPTPNRQMVNTIQSIPPETAHIRDYIIWTVINLFLGGILIGFLAILLTIKTRKRKQEGNIESAKKWSRATLIVNILITLASIAIIVVVVVHYINAKQTVYTYHY